jgi:hypothetical protein
MPRGSYAEVVKGPARRLEGSARAFEIDDALVDALLADIESGGHLKLVHYDELGRVKGSIEAALERALKVADADPAVPKDRVARLDLLRRGLIPWLAGIDSDTRRTAPSRRPAVGNPSQSLGELSETSTEDATRTAMASVSERRATEQQSCPAGTTRVAGECVPSAASRFAADPPNAIALLALAQSLTMVPVRPLAPDPPHWAVWAQGYGDYEQRSGQSRGPSASGFSALALTANSTMWTGGMLGGADYTLRNVASAGDGLIGGVLIGYESSHVSLRTSSVSSDPTIPNGNSTFNAQLSGPAAGVYASYFNRGFSTDIAFKAEFYSLDVGFADLLGFQSNPQFGLPPTSVPYSGSGTTRLDNYTVAGNVNYRFPTSAMTWVEPTGGFEYVISRYAAGADQFGLADGSLFRLQGGARLGFDGVWNGLGISTVVTGLLYDDVLVNGGALASAPNPEILSDQGLLRGEGILTLNFNHGNGVTSFVQAELEGGKDLFGAGGKLGVRVAW